MANSRRRGRPATIPDEVIVSVRTMLAAGVPVATVAKRHRISRRVCRDILAGVARPSAVPRPPEIAALEGDPDPIARDIVELSDLLALAAPQIGQAGRR